MTLHNDSKSQTKLRLQGGGLVFRSQVQSLSLIEELPGLDRDGDGILSAEECEAGQDQIISTLASGFLFGSPGQVAKPSGGQAIQLLPRTLDGFGMPQLQQLSVAWSADLPSGANDQEGLLLANTLFQTTSPGHQDLLTYRFDAQAERTQKWTAGGRSQVLMHSPTEDTPPWPGIVSCAWQGGAGLALVLVILCAHGGGQIRLPKVLLGGVLFLLSALAGSFGFSGLQGVGLAGSWFLPVALIYLLADARLGGGLLRSPFAMVLWGLCFSVGCLFSPAGSPALEPGTATWLVPLSAGLCLLLAGLLRPLWARFPASWGMRLAWLVSGMVCLLRIKSSFE